MAYLLSGCGPVLCNAAVEPKVRTVCAGDGHACESWSPPLGAIRDVFMKPGQHVLPLLTNCPLVVVRSIAQ